MYFILLFFNKFYLCMYVCVYGCVGSSLLCAGIFPDQGSNPCPLHWQADSQPLCHQGSRDLGRKMLE